MSLVFVGNPTLQNRDFHYRIPRVNTPRVLHIPAGGQARIPGELAGPELASVIEQLERYGAVPDGDIRAIVLTNAFIYKVEANPIRIEVLEEGLARDEEARQEVSATKMEEAGLVAFQNAQAQNPGKIVETSLEFVEVTDRGAVKHGVNAEVIVSAKPSRRAGRKRTEDKN